LAASNAKQANLRKKNQKRGLTVPPILIFSVTNRCNLACRGCYACAQGRDLSGELDIRDIEKIITEAKALGTTIVLFAGGEPLVREGLLDIAAHHPQLLFLVFSNGLLFDARAIEQIKANKHIIPVISLEGDEETTDARRGSGVYRAVMATAQRLKVNRIVFGSSITLTSRNYDMVVNERFIRDLKEMGSLAVFMIEYVPELFNRASRGKMSTFPISQAMFMAVQLP